MIRPFLTDTASLLHQLRPGFATLSQSAPVLADAFAIGTRTLPPTAELDARTVSLAEALKNYSQNTVVQGGLDRLTLTLGSSGAAGVPHAGPGVLQLRDPVLAQHLEPALRARHPGHIPALRAALDRARRGQPERTVAAHLDSCRSAATRGRCTPTPIRTPIRPGQPAECAAGNETVQGQPGRHRQSTGQPRPADREDEGEPRREAPPLAGVQPDRRRGRRDHRARSSATWCSAGRFRSPARRSSSRRCSPPRPSCTSPPRYGSPASTSGTVTSVKRVAARRRAAVVTMAIQPNGLPIHADATVDIRPRLFLEGNFYVDLHPGTPSAPTVSSADTLPAANTTGPVQLDRVLVGAELRHPRQPADARAGLRRRAERPPDGRRGRLPGPQPARADRRAVAQPVAEVRRGRVQGLGDRQRGAARPQPHDLSGVVAGNAAVFGALASEPGQLADLVTRSTRPWPRSPPPAGPGARRSRCCPARCGATDTALGPLQASFAPTRQFARELTPSIRQLGPTIDAGAAVARQSIALFSPQELRGLLASLTPAVQGTSATLTATKSLLNAVRRRWRAASPTT